MNASLVSGIYFGSGVATDGAHVYWGSTGSSPTQARIGRATIDGGDPDGAFQPAGTFCGVVGIVATATDLVWLKTTCSGIPDRAINRVAKTGNQGGATEPVAANGICGLAVDATYLYWSESHYIGRVPLAGGVADHRWLDVGRLVRGTCAKPTRRTARKPTCDLALATLAVHGRAGRNALPFSGRVGGRPLPPGRYRATLVARAGGLASSAVAIGFRVARP